jgi:hypothetical protein
MMQNAVRGPKKALQSAIFDGAIPRRRGNP